jgi:HSP20 family protein
VRSINRISWMWDEAVQALEQAERRRRQFCGLSAARPAQPLWEPPADVFESESELLVCVALPGVRPDSVSVQVAASGVIVSAERQLPAEVSRLRVHRLEIPYGRFERQLELTSGRYVVIESRLVDGCLMLRLGKE